MIDFAFEPVAGDDSWSPDWQPDHPELSSSDFCLEYFKADRRLIIHGVDLSVHLLGEPVVDFALMIDYATRELANQHSISVEASLTQHQYSFNSRSGDCHPHDNVAAGGDGSSDLVRATGAGRKGEDRSGATDHHRASRTPQQRLADADAGAPASRIEPTVAERAEP